MKKIAFIAISLFSINLLFGSLEEVLENFEAPHSDYSTIPFWVWNDAVTRDKIDRDLKSFHERGMYGAFVHPRPGIISAYLMDEWFEMWEYAYEKAEALGMKLWIYDENSFPSGFAGGHMASEMPESVSTPTALTITDLGTGEGIDTSEFEILVRSSTSNTVISEDSLPNENEGTLYGFTAHIQTTNGWYGGSRYTDLLIPGVTEKFIEVTMRGYEEILGDELGNGIPGVFTDEPNIRPYGANDGIRITPSLWEDFKNRWDYDLKPHLPSLFYETGDWKRVRHNYYGLLLELFIERWSKPWYEYTEKKGLKWTGHYWEHGWPNPTHGGDNMAMYAWHQVPGIDMLFNNREHRPDQFGNVRAVKELSSVANQLNLKRTLSETHGGSGWDLDFADMKRLNDWQMTLGVNLVNQHLTFMTLKGRRKGDFPPSFSYHAPYWDDYKVLAEYLHRVSYVLSQGKQINHTLLLEPTSTTWMYYTPKRDSAHLAGVEKSFRQLLDHMESLQIEYDLASENIMKDHGSVDGDRWIIGHREYDTVILPQFTENLEQSTAGQLIQYLKGGGRLILVGEAPHLVDGKPSTTLSTALDQYANQITQLTGVRNPLRAHVIANAGLGSPGFTPVNPLDYGGQVHHMRRQLDADSQIYFWSNFSETETAQVEFLSTGKYVLKLNPKTGNIYQVDAPIEGDEVRISFQLPPAGSYLCLITNTKPGSDSYKPIKTPKTTVNASWVELPGKSKIMPSDKNTLVIDYLDIEIDSTESEGVYFADAGSQAYRENGLESYGRFGYNPWSVAVQYKTNILDMAEIFGPDSGYTADYPIYVDEGFSPQNIEAVVEYAHLYEIRLNGELLEPQADKWWLDEDFEIIDLGDRLKPGKNLLSLSLQPMHIHAEVEPVFIRGDFAVKSMNQGFKISAPKPLSFGAWSNQGMPLYSGSVRYERELQAKADSRYKVKLGEWYGTVARVLVNNEQVGHIFGPYESIEITQSLNDGSNRVTVEVVGSLQNVLGPHHRDFELGLVTPWSWMIGPGEQPGGDEYHVYEYGLFEEFKILESQ